MEANQEQLRVVTNNQLLLSYGAYEETNTGSLGALPDRVPLQSRPLCPVGDAIPTPLWLLTG
jgi:hypothetical protein